jgi:hypothetical protein
VTVAAVAMLATAACSSAGDDAGGSPVAAEADPVATFCDDWQRFDTLTNSDEDPTPALVQEVIVLQDEMGTILPLGLDAEWASILAWNNVFIDYFETAGYDDLSEEAITGLFGGEEAIETAGQAREDAYSAIGVWARQNCPGTDEAAFCDLWPEYDEFLESEAEPTEELIAQLLDMQADIDEVLPPDLATAWTGIVDWNQAFIDVFEQFGYGPVTDQTFEQAFGGDDHAAGAAQEAIENGLATIRNWTDRNCGPETEVNFAFCSALSELTALIADEDSLTPESYEEALAVVDRVGADVPAAVRGDWNAVVESARGFHDVLVSVGFRPERITDDLLEQAFGSVEAAVAIEEAADTGLAELEQWSLTGCGDFCSRWPEFRRALDETQAELWWVRELEDSEGEGHGKGRLAEHVRLFEIGSQLVPDEVRAEWDAAVDARRDWIAWQKQMAFDQGGWESRGSRDRGLEIMRGATYLAEDELFDDHDAHGIGRDRRRVLAAWQSGIDRAPAWLAAAEEIAPHEHEEIAAWLEGYGEPPQWVAEYWYWGPQGWFEGQLVGSIDGWVGDNCDAVTGRPGTIRVKYPSIEGAAGDTLVMALLPHGGSVGDLATQSSILAGWCEGVQSDPWGTWFEGGQVQHWESGEFRSERWEEGGLCDYRHEQGSAIFDAGTYTMVAAVVAGGGWIRPDVPLSATACLAFDIEVDGDTIVDVPDLPACGVDFGANDDPWRNPPAVDPSTPGAGTLQIVFPDLVGDGHGGEVRIVVLPGGTTLNEIGREQVWPVGATQTWLFDPNETEQEHVTREVAVPIAELPVSGSPRSLGTHWLAERPPADRLPLAVLAPGEYDVHVQLAIHDPPQQEESDAASNDRCVSFEVTIAGDTVVDLPELGECPRIW